MSIEQIIRYWAGRALTEAGADRKICLEEIFSFEMEDRAVIRYKLQVENQKVKATEAFYKPGAIFLIGYEYLLQRKR